MVEQFLVTADNYDGLFPNHLSRGEAIAQDHGYQGIYLEP
jgi:hypothetical protein